MYIANIHGFSASAHTLCPSVQRRAATAKSSANFEKPENKSRHGREKHKGEEPANPVSAHGIFNFSRSIYCAELVPEKGVEPSRPCGQRILSPPRLPFRHSGQDTNETITPRPASQVRNAHIPASSNLPDSRHNNPKLKPARHRAALPLLPLPALPSLLPCLETSQP